MLMKDEVESAWEWGEGARIGFRDTGTGGDFRVGGE